MVPTQRKELDRQISLVAVTFLRELFGGVLYGIEKGFFGVQD